MIPIDMLVATSADFALLRNGRPLASGGWHEVREARASRERPFGVGRITLVLALGNGRAFTATDDAPGWDDLLEAAEQALPGFPPYHEWWSGNAGDIEESADVLLFSGHD
jgi:hypothetical protein